MLLADSSVWVDYFNGVPSPQTEVLDSALGRDLVAVGDIMLAEVLQGFSSERHFKIARDLMLSLDVVNVLDTSIALKSAENYRMLRRKGLTVRKTTDCIIATWCIENDASLLHSDKDFEPFERHLGLQAIPL
jgi:predicted nucleic acid-binding protein